MIAIIYTVGVSESAALANEDGRHARRDRNKDAVVDAYLAMVRDGNPRPSIADVADRSGVSHRSVFRYFADKDELARTAIERQHAFVGPLVVLTVGPGASFAERIQRFVDRRLELFDVLAPVARLSRTLVQLQPVVAAELTTSRRYLRAQITHVFQAEFAALSADEARRAAAAIDVLCSFESVELLRFDQEFSTVDTAAVIARSIRALLRND